MSCSEECVEVNNGNCGLAIGKIFRLDNIHASDMPRMQLRLMEQVI